MPGILTVVGYIIKEFYLFVSYVKNNAFPQPLSSQDEKRYLKLMSEGDGDAR
ncbi:RNA polymerase subunit sigma-70, partial [Peribacillus frigoritolerans]|nr:RNA polymerase subunit sigma-70 [Peribacillus frigoritolerans]